MTYNPDIPDLANDVNADVPRIQTNFEKLNDLYALDHYAFDVSIPSAQRGLHKLITMPEVQASDPSLSGSIGIVYPKADANDSNARAQMYYRNTTSAYQLTNRFYSPSTGSGGYYALPMGTSSRPSLMFMWGSVDGTAFTNDGGGSYVDILLHPVANYVYGGGQTYGFPNDLFNVQVTLSVADYTTKTVVVDNNSGGGGLSPTKESFRILSNVTKISIGTVYWYAIGN